MTKTLQYTGKVADRERNDRYDLEIHSADSSLTRPNSYVLRITKEGDKVGFASVQRAGGTAQLETVYLEPSHREKGLSHILMELFCELSDQEGLRIGETRAQKRPYNCLLLNKYGFSPLVIVISDYIVGHLFKLDSELGFYIPDTEKRERFLESELAKDCDCKLLTKPPKGAEEIEEGLEIFLGLTYLPIDSETLEEQRRKNQERFNISITRNEKAA